MSFNMLFFVPKCVGGINRLLNKYTCDGFFVLIQFFAATITSLFLDIYICP